MRRVPVLLFAAFALMTARGAESSAPPSWLCNPEADTFDGAVLESKCRAWRADEARLRAAYRDCLARVDHPAIGIVIPLETHPDGTLKVMATAGKAQFFEGEGLVWCGDVTMREFSASGKLLTSLAARGCIVDRNTKSGWMEGDAHGVYEGTSLDGEGIYFSFEDEFVRISSKVKVITTEFKFEGVKL